MSDPVSEYAAGVPEAVRLAVDSLGSSDDRTYAVVMAIDEAGPLRFGELEDRLELHPEKLSTVLGDLVKGGVVSKRAGDPVGAQSTGAYALTEFGDAILDGLVRAVRHTDDSSLVAEPARGEAGDEDGETPQRL